VNSRFFSASSRRLLIQRLVVVSIGSAWIGRALKAVTVAASKHANCDTNESAEPDHQEAGCFPKRATTLLLGAQNQPEMAPRLGPQNMACADPPW